MQIDGPRQTGPIQGKAPAAPQAAPAPAPAAPPAKEQAKLGFKTDELAAFNAEREKKKTELLEELALLVQLQSVNPDPNLDKQIQGLMAQLGVSDAE